MIRSQRPLVNVDDSAGPRTTAVASQAHPQLAPDAEREAYLWPINVPRAGAHVGPEPRKIRPGALATSVPGNRPISLAGDGRSARRPLALPSPRVHLQLVRGRSWTQVAGGAVHRRTLELAPTARDSFAACSRCSDARL